MACRPVLVKFESSTCALIMHKSGMLCAASAPENAAQTCSMMTSSAILLQLAMVRPQSEAAPGLGAVHPPSTRELGELCVPSCAAAGQPAAPLEPAATQRVSRRTTQWRSFDFHDTSALQHRPKKQAGTHGCISGWNPGGAVISHLWQCPTSKCMQFGHWAGILRHKEMCASSQQKGLLVTAHLQRAWRRCKSPEARPVRL